MADYMLDLRMGVDAKLNASTVEVNESTAGTISYAVDNRNLRIDAKKADGTFEKQLINADLAYGVRDGKEDIIAKPGYGNYSFQNGKFREEQITQIKLSRAEGFVDATYNYEKISGNIDISYTYILKYPAYEQDGKITYHKVDIINSNTLFINDFSVQYYTPDSELAYELIRNQDGCLIF